MMIQCMEHFLFTLLQCCVLLSPQAREKSKLLPEEREEFLKTERRKTLQRLREYKMVENITLLLYIYSHIY